MPRDLTVRVRADVGAYQKAMSAAASSTDELAQSGLRLQRVGMQISNIGDNLTKHVTLPLALVGGAAVKMASDFDKSFTQMQTLAGVSADAVDGLKESVLDLSGKTGRAPQELAEALYFLQSSGLDSADAMEALEASAKASAVGLGDTATVADAVSSAMLAYAQSGLEAAEATDILIATAKAGKAEPAELASQMGRLLPIASELGISFDQVGGAIAALSQKGNNAEQATTQLVNVMSKLLKPSEQAAQLLESVGLSAEGVRQMLAEKGLLGTLEELRSRLGDSGFTKFLEDTQAIQGGLSLLGGDLNKTRDIFDQVKQSAGETDNAFGTWAESMGAKNARAFADFQVALIHMGDVLAPIASQVLDFTSGIAEAFSNLPTGAQQAIIAFGLVMAAMGPLLSVTGRLITGVGTAMRMLENFALPAGTVSGAFSEAAVSTSRFSSALAGLAKAGAVVGILVALRETLGTMNDEVDRASLSDLQKDLLDLAETGEATGSTLKRVFAGPGGEGLLPTGDLAQDAVQIKTDINQIDEALASLEARDPAAAADAFKAISAAMKEQGLSTSDIKGQFDNYNDALADAEVSNRTTASAVDEATGAIEGETGATEEATSALERYLDALHARLDPMFAAVSASHALADANNEVTAKEMELAAAIQEHGADSLEAMAATDALTRAREDASSAAFDQEAALVGLVDMVRKEPGALDSAKAKLQEWVAQGWITQATADATAAKFDEVTGAAESIPAAVNTAVTTTGTGVAAADLNAVKAKADAIPREINVVTRVQTILAGSTSVPMKAGGGDVQRGKAYIVGEKRPELFVPDHNGTIYPSVPATVPSPVGFGGGAGGAPQVTYQLVFNGPTNDRQVIEAIKRFEQSNGTSWRAA